jgi:hypothetical protein
MKSLHQDAGKASLFVGGESSDYAKRRRAHRLWSQRVPPFPFELFAQSRTKLGSSRNSGATPTNCRPNHGLRLPQVPKARHHPRPSYGDATVSPWRDPGVVPMGTDPHGSHTGMTPGRHQGCTSTTGWGGVTLGRWITTLRADPGAPTVSKLDRGPMASRWSPFWQCQIKNV